jgi:hypothetical protein
VDPRAHLPRQFDDTPDVVKFAETLEKACVDVIESGRMTKDLAILIRPDHPFLSTEEFLDAIDGELTAPITGSRRGPLHQLPPQTRLARLVQWSVRTGR